MAFPLQYLPKAGSEQFQLATGFLTGVSIGRFINMRSQVKLVSRLRLQGAKLFSGSVNVGERFFEPTFLLAWPKCDIFSNEFFGFFLLRPCF